MPLPAQNLQHQPAAYPAAYEAPKTGKPEKTIPDLAKLASLHAEAAETARLANLLGRSSSVIFFIAAVSGAAAFLLADITAGATQVWLMLSLGSAAALLIAYARAINAPFERAALLSFREDLKAVLLYAGFAWGAGAWLLLPYDTSAATVVAFAAGPVGAIAALTRDRDCAFLFGVPVTLLVSFASVLQPFSDAGLDAGLILIACGAIGATMLTAERVGRSGAALPIFKQIKA